MNRDKTLLKIILKEVTVLQDIAQQLDEHTFLASETAKRAVVMTLINIGEKVKDLSAELKQNHPDVPWRQISGIRDMAAHAYLQLNFERVWNTVIDDIPIFREQLQNIIK
ncbi:MAG: DUF86 domain-containing protein [Candidatus Cloacimonetes bacterium]|nr:DUF86 domain-containing protein [Candidatus Cloacimonadota bacterium]